jgi:hypothetical protein
MVLWRGWGTFLLVTADVFDPSLYPSTAPLRRGGALRVGSSVSTLQRVLQSSLAPKSLAGSPFRFKPVPDSLAVVLGIVLGTNSPSHASYSSSLRASSFLLLCSSSSPLFQIFLPQEVTRPLAWRWKAEAVSLPQHGCRWKVECCIFKGLWPS